MWRTNLVGMLTVVGCLLLGYGTVLPLLQKPAPHGQARKPLTLRRPEVDALVSRIDQTRMTAHIRVLAGDIGVRKSGTPQEGEAARYIATVLRTYGYQVRITPVDLHGHGSTRNVVASKPGQAGRELLIGAHMDSKAPAPGANDNASGIAVMLELARVLQDTDTPCVFVAFGGEERIDRQRDHHHYGSRKLAADKAFRAGLASMTSLDMVGVGHRLYIESNSADTAWRDRIAIIAKRQGYPIHVGHGSPQSDHEAFEHYGIPTAYLHWERDPHYHRSTDTPGRITASLLTKTAALLVRSILAADGS